MVTKSLFRQTLDEVPAETHIFIQKYTGILDLSQQKPVFLPTLQRMSHVRNKNQYRR